MKVYRDSSEFIKGKKAVITVGSFDGLHIGHLKILEKLLEISRNIDGTSVLLTFEPHPRTVIAKDFTLKILTTLEEKKLLLSKIGVENLIVQKFTKEFSQMSSDEFIKKILVDDIGITHIVIGHDHKFGKDRLGDEEKLRNLGQQYNFDVTSVDAETIDCQVVSSTKIRNALFEGNIEKANMLLGREYSLSGVVVKGTQRGRLLGFPTANIQLDNENKAVPKKGVYVVSCRCRNEDFYGVMNIGFRPTFENSEQIVIEVYLFDFNDDIYGEQISVNFINRIRDEKKFESKEELINQINVDLQKAKEVVKKLEHN